MEKFLGIDYGSAKIGLALADFQTKVVLPWKVMETKFFFNFISSAIVEEGITAIVVGWPLNFNNQSTNQTREVELFVQKLKKRVSVPVETSDERLTTAQAIKLGQDDAVAAASILQVYLQRRYGSDFA